MPEEDDAGGDNDRHRGEHGPVRREAGDRHHLYVRRPRPRAWLAAQTGAGLWFIHAPILEDAAAQHDGQTGNEDPTAGRWVSLGSSDKSGGAFPRVNVPARPPRFD